MSIPPPDPIPTLRQQLSQGGYAAHLTDHCQLVEQFENLVVVVIQLWEMNNALRERLDLTRQPLPIAARTSALQSLACATGTVALIASEPFIAEREWEARSEGR